MAGHSQFKNIMHRKGKQDGQKARVFAKFAREITVAAKAGTPDPEMNPRLRLAIQGARAENMPKDNIERAIKKALGNDGENYDTVRYEGYGPGGVAIIVEALTDNRNRTGGAVRAWFTKYGGNLGTTGQVSHMFSHVGEITFKPESADADAMLEASIDAGADDVASDVHGHLITCSFDTLGSTAGALEAKFGSPTSVKAVWKPNLTTPVDQEKAETILKLLGGLEEDDDVQQVFSNVEVDDATMARLAG